TTILPARPAWIRLCPAPRSCRSRTGSTCSARACASFSTTEDMSHPAFNTLAAGAWECAAAHSHALAATKESGRRCSFGAAAPPRTNACEWQIGILRQQRYETCCITMLKDPIIILQRELGGLEGFALQIPSSVGVRGAALPPLAPPPNRVFRGPEAPEPPFGSKVSL